MMPDNNGKAALADALGASAEERGKG